MKASQSIFRRIVAWKALPAFLFLFAHHAYSAPSPEGRWKTVDDATGKAKSMVRLWVENDRLVGQIDSIFPEPGKSTDPVCDKCPGTFHNKRVKAIHFLWGLKKSGEEWIGGEVLDPKNGKIYRCKIKVKEDNRTMVVRGYIGVSLLGRSQTWERLD
jgi:uncharacterized protein (DUF2147 family)